MDLPTSPELKESLGVEKELVSTAADEAGFHTCSNITVDEEATGQVKLKQLHIAEQVLQKKARVAMLKKAIKEAEQRLATLAESLQPSPTTATHKSPPFVQSTGLGLANTSKQEPPQLPLDALLAGAQTSVSNMVAMTSGQANKNSTSGSSRSLQHSPGGPVHLPQAQQEPLVFLKPAHLSKGEHVLVSYGPKKSKLENTTMAQWVDSNTCIFFTLLKLGKLPSPRMCSIT